MERNAVASVRCLHPRSAAVHHADLIVAEALAAALRTSGLFASATATDDVDALLRFRELPALVVMAGAESGEVGDVVEALAHRRLAVPVLACRASIDPAGLLRDLLHGASGVTTLASTPAQFTAVARAVLAGWLVVPAELRPAVQDAIAHQAAEQAAAQDRLAAMTPRQREVLDLMAKGHRQREIAVRLGVSAHTARTHVDSVRAKLSAGSQLHASVEARRTLALASAPALPFAPPGVR